MDDQLAVAHPFDAVAPRYDRDFTDQRLGAWLRQVVWREMDRSFHPGDVLLDLGCGTGEDACHLAEKEIEVTAIDASREMLAKAQAKAKQRGVTDRMRLAQLDLRKVTTAADLTAITGAGTIDGAYADFGPLNCLADRRPLAAALAGVVRPGGTVIAVMMGPLCPWEFSWYLLHGHPRTATRRFRRGVRSEIGDGELRVWYPTPRRLRSEFHPHFAHVKTIGIGVFLPPSDLGRLVDNAPNLFTVLNELDERAREHVPWTWLNDHYLSVFRRRDEE